MKKILLVAFFALLSSSVLFAQRQMETLDRGLVAIKVSGGVYASWRIPGDEWYDVTYNLYRDGVKVNDAPLAVSNYTDPAGTTASTYTVRAVVGGTEQAACAPASVWSHQYWEIPMQDVYKNGVNVTDQYTLNDASVADLDGDGVMEVIIKRMNTDFSASCTNYCLFQAYKLDGTLLWTIDMGPNLINAGHVETDCMAFDFDEDGRAEVVLRGTDGTILPDGTVIGNATINYREQGTFEYQCYGDEWLIVLDGTGKLLDSVIFDQKEDGTGNNLARRSAAFWWDGNSKAYGHRANKFHFGAPYLDGRHPSISLVRNCYTNMHAAAYDLVDGKLKLRWANWEDSPSSIWYGQGYHNSSVLDVDGDGRDELCQGNMVIDDDGSWLSSTGLGHGDAQHYGDMDPYRKGIEGFRCLETNPGAVFVDAATSEILFRWIRGNDCGRCMAGNFTDLYPGYELWTTDGKLWSASTSRAADQTVQNGCTGVTMNNRIYWDGDLLDESFDYGPGSGSSNTSYGINPSVYKWGNSDPIFSATGCITNNWSKGNPSMQADIFGDWREEFIVPTSDNRSLRIYTTVTPTEHRIYSLLYDHQYRQAVYWQMNGYNQPPHVSFFLGNLEGITLPPPPACTNGKVEVTTSLSNATDGQFVLMAQTTATSVAVSGTVAPANVMVNSPADYTVTGGTWSGSMRLLKMGEGRLSLSGCTLNHTGNTEIWGGTLDNHADLPNSNLILKRFAEATLSGTYKNIKMEYGSILRPAAADAEAGRVAATTLDLDGGAIIEVNITDAQVIDGVTADTVRLAAANPIGAVPVVRVVIDGTLEAGDYVLVAATKELSVSADGFTVEGIQGVSYETAVEGNALILRVKAQRAAAAVVWSGATSDVWDLNRTANFLNGGVADVFVSGDAVTFDATAASRAVTIAENVRPSSVTVTGSEDYTFTGSGMISGATALVKEGSGTLTIDNTNDFTGGVRILGGTVRVASLSDAQNVGALGAYTTETGRFYIGGGATLQPTASLTNACPIEVGDGAIINASASFTQDAAVSGGTLVKDGNGALTFRSYNNIKKLQINAGTVNIPAEYQGSTALGDTVVLNGGTLQFNDNTGTYASSYAAWVVPEGAKATARLDSRCNYRGTLSGSGDLTIYVPAYYRTYLYGDWSAFTGTLHATGAQSATYPIVLTNTKGMPAATLNIPNAADVVQIGNDNVSTTGTYRVGALTGKGILGVGAGSANTFEVGALDTDFTFDGSSNAVLTKVGSGQMTLTANTGSGSVVVQAGTLRVYNAATATTSATGTGTLTVKDGALLTGRGYMGNGRVTIESGGTFRPGLLYLSTLTLASHLSLNEGGVLEFRINTNTTNSSVTIGGSALFDGLIRVIARSDYVPAIGDTFSLWTCKTFNKSHTPTWELPELPAGMKWDTSQLCTTTGTITIVADETGLATIAANEPVAVTVVDISGKTVASLTCAYSMVTATVADADRLPAGLYILRIQGAGSTEVRKYMKR